MSRLSRLRALAASSFVFSTVAQARALLDALAPVGSASASSIVQRLGEANARYSPYAPHPYFLAALFLSQVGVQLYWLRRMYPSAGQSASRYQGGRTRRRETPETEVFWEVEENNISDGGAAFDAMPVAQAESLCEPTQMVYAPFYIGGNLLVGASFVAGMLSNHILLSQSLVLCNCTMQLAFALIVLRPSGGYPLTRANRTTHLVAKTNAGVSVLHALWLTWGMLSIGAGRPRIQQQAHCGVLLVLITCASGPDPTLGICIFLDLLALIAGRTDDPWRLAFSWMTGVVLAIAVLDFWLDWRTRGRLFQPQAYDHGMSGSGYEEDPEVRHAPHQIWLAEMSTRQRDRV